ncbi:MAG: DUF1080 domain-containing protein [Planctomycetes bacterium]|nr:DUF1080 domain-containing protein [Planctomycetota bacterium]
MKNLPALMIVGLLAAPGNGQSVDLFNGRDLRGWDGDPAVWTVEDGAIVGRVAEGTHMADHTYLIWQGGPVRDFELSLQFRSEGGNSGVDYRADRIAKSKTGQDLRWTLQGYQADIVPNWMGSFYNWQRAGAQPGQFAIVTTAPGDKGGQATKVFPLADANAVRSLGYYRPDRWNEYTITVRGEHVIHRINGFQTVELIDVSDLKRTEGYLGFQVHAGNKKQVHRFKEVRLEPLRHAFGRPLFLRGGPQATGLEVLEPDNAPPPGPDALAFVVHTPAGAMVQTKERFADCILRFQFRRDANDLSVWLRIGEGRRLGVTGIGRSSARIDHEGDSRLRVVEIPKIPPALEPSFDTSWDDCEISLIGGELDVKINGRLRTRAVDGARARGTIGFASNTSKIVRNVVLIPVLP